MPTDDGRDGTDDPHQALDGGGDPLAGLFGGLGGGGEGGGGLDLGGLLQSAMDMQAQLVEAQQEMANTIVTGSAGGGAVEIDVTGGFEFLAVRIAPAAIDPDDAEMLQDLVLAALHDAGRAVGDLQQVAAPAMPDLDALGFGGDPLAALAGGFADDADDAGASGDVDDDADGDGA